MTILFCYKNNLIPTKGGVQKVTDTLAKYFLKNGHRVVYLIHENESFEKTYQYPAEVFYLPESDFFSYKNVEYYQDLLLKLSIDVIINQDGSNNRSDFFLSTGISNAVKISAYHNDPLYGVSFLVKSTDTHVKKFIKDNISFVHYYYSVYKRRLELKKLLTKGDAVVFLSQAFIENINRLLYIKSENIFAIGNPIDNIVLKGKRQPKKKQVLFVGRLEITQKRPDLLLKIWSLVESEMPDWELLLLGDGQDRLELEELAKKINIKNVSFEGFVNPQKYYEESSILCLTSDYEGFGMVIVEAMQNDVVPIAFNNWDSIKDIIINEKTGLLIERDNVGLYAEKLILLMRDELYRQHLISNFSSILAKFEVDKIGNEWLKLFERYCK